MGLDLSELLAQAPYSLSKEKKAPMFNAGLTELTRHHYAHCVKYANICNSLGFDPFKAHDAVDFPFLPTRLFKLMELKSVADGDVQRVLTSSGTSGQATSKIYLDALTAQAQTKVLSKIVSDYIGPQRLPMLVIDAAATVKVASQFSARTAGIIGYSIFGRDVTYALNDDRTVNVAAIEDFCARHAGEKIFIFGFTFIIYQYFIQALAGLKKKVPLDSGILIHGGGWKKLVDIAVDNDTFKKMLADVSGIKKVHNYYGLVEQTGSIFVECEHGHLHCSNFSDIIMRDKNFTPLGVKQKGMVEVMSLLPHGYPGHVLLTEDEGTWLGEDDCACGRKGKYFKIHGRIPQAEVRGCSDTYTAR